jgi:NitT/TauT family transport system substrate-binding protein
MPHRQPLSLSRRALHRATVAAAALAVMPGLLRAQQPAMSKLRIAAINLLTFSPVFVARELGYYKAEGLDVDILETTSGNATTSALLGGSVAAATTGFSQPLLLAEQGKTVKHLVGMDMASIYVFVGSPKLVVPPDNPQALAAALKGKRFGLASLGSTGHVIAEGVLAEYGTPSKDVTFVAIGTGATALAAFKAGAVDAIISYEPDLTQVLQAGAGKIVLDLRTTKVEKTFSRLPTSTLQATGEWIDKNPDTAARLVRAVARANKTLREDSAKSLEVLAKLYPNVPKASLQGMYEASRANFQSPVPEEQYQHALQVYMKSNQVKKPVPYDSVVAAQFKNLWATA